jgi:hypothetical protein
VIRPPGRAAAVAALLLPAFAALAYLLPPSAVLKRLAQKREEVAAPSMEVRGLLVAGGEAGRALAAAAGLPAAGSPGSGAPAPDGDVSLVAVISIKAPGRCRLELAPPGAAGAPGPASPERAWIAVGRGRLSGARGLDRISPVVALVRGLCALLGPRASGADPGRAWAEELSRLGVSLGDESLGRAGARVAYVLGAAQPRERKPQVWIDKQSWQPLRLVAPLSGALDDVRLLDFGSVVGGDLFPQTVEVRQDGALALRFATEKVAANPRIPDALFP